MHQMLKTFMTRMKNFLKINYNPVVVVDVVVIFVSVAVVIVVIDDHKTHIWVLTIF